MDEDASTRLAGLFKSHHAEVLAYCVRRIGHVEGEDAAAEVFAVASRRVNEIDWETVRPWLYGVARGVLNNRRRSLYRVMRRDRRMKGLAVAVVESPHDIVVRSIAAQEAITALRRLTPVDREILMLSAWEDLQPLEIAASLGISVVAARRRLARARNRFARVLKPETNPLGSPGPVFDEGASL